MRKNIFSCLLFLLSLSLFLISEAKLLASDNLLDNSVSDNLINSLIVNNLLDSSVSDNLINSLIVNNLIDNLIVDNLLDSSVSDNLINSLVVNNLVDSLIVNNLEIDSLVFDLNTTYEPRVALIFSGGGARGSSHIGALKCLEEHNISFDYIAGTSIGAIIGSFYASGFNSKQIDSIFTQTDWKNIFKIKNNRRKNLFYQEKETEDKSILELHFRDFNLIFPEALSTGDNLNSFLYEAFTNATYFPINDFSDLKYSFIAVATDLSVGKSVALSSGNLFRSVRASSTMPLNYSPVRIDSMTLIDGGIMANVPVLLAISKFSPDITIAFDASSLLHPPDKINTPLKIADQSISASMVYFTEQNLALADIIVRPDVAMHSGADFSNLADLISAGYDATKSKLDDINILYNKKLDSFLLNSQFSVLFNYELEFSGFDEADLFVISNQETNLDKIKLLNNLVVANKYKSIVARFAQDNTSKNNTSKNNTSKNNFSEYNSSKNNSSKNNTSNYYKIIAHKYKKLSNITLSGTYSSIATFALDSALIKYKNNLLTSTIIRELKEFFLEIYRAKYIPYTQVYVSTINDSVLGVNIVESILREIEIIGNISTKDNIIKKQINTEIGELLTASKINNIYNILMNSNWFIDIDLRVLPVHNGSKLLIKVSEGGNQTLKLTSRIDNERNLRVGTYFISDNIFSTQVQNQIYFNIGSRDRNFELGFNYPQLFSTDITTSIKTYYSWMKINSFAQISEDKKFYSEITGENIIERYGANAAVGVQIERQGLLNIAYRLEKQGTKTKDFYETGMVSLVKFSFDYDSEDSYYFTTYGSLFSISLETGVFFPKTRDLFSKVSMFARTGWGYKDFYVRPSIFFGAGDKTMPYPEFFTLGGQTSFFGLRENEEMGRQIFNTSLEFRQKVSEIFSLLNMNTYLGLRYDLGSTWLEPAEIKFSSLKHGLGIVLSLESPIGVASLSLGRAFIFNQTGSIHRVKLGIPQIYFSMGTKM